MRVAMSGMMSDAFEISTLPAPAPCTLALGLRTVDLDSTESTGEFTDNAVLPDSVALDDIAATSEETAGEGGAAEATGTAPSV
jgi:hypothetical protein